MKDFFQIHNLLSEEELAIQKTAAEFVQSEYSPFIQRHFRDGSFPVEIIPRLGEFGFLGAAFPVKYGGSGISNVAYGLLMQELECGDSGLRSFASVQGGLVMYPIFRFGSEDQKKTWLPKLSSGKAIGCFGLTEPEHGSDPGGMKTTAKRDGKDWILNGAKMWITNGSIADIAVVWAKDEGGIIQGFLVEKDTPGFSAPEMHGKMSLRASVTSELVLEDVRITEKNRLPNTNGLSAPLSCLTQARYSIAWGVIGAAIDCYRTALEYAKDRKQFGKPIAGFQLTQKKFADMLSEIIKAQLLVVQLGRLKDAGMMTFQQVSMAKRNNVEMAMNVARTARGILGANGITDDYPIMRHMANLESVFTYEGTHEMHTLILGETITGIKAFE
ncbi:MAG: acyl-CoA dehydrogenase family protein [Candidatus Marinimicrobia bacterium]|nr:acyl-CoA dehydrogenase family protein [Candidatus Neomarinimicrobiota bacterium]